MTGKEIVIKRVFNTSRGRVWQAWTEPKEMIHWWGPKGFSIPSCRMNVVAGGDYFFCMRSPEGQDVCGTGIYREVVELEKIVMTDVFADAKGNEVPPTYYDIDEDWPDEVLISVSFESPEECNTLVTLRHAGLPAGEMCEQTKTGWNESFDKLAELLAGNESEK